MKSLLLSLLLVCGFATTSFADERVETVKSRTNGNHSSVQLIRCADGWVPATTNCTATNHNMAATPSPIPGPESMDPTLHTRVQSESDQTSENQVATR